MFIFYHWLFTSTLRDKIPEISVFSTVPMVTGIVELFGEVGLVWLIVWAYKRRKKKWTSYTR